MLRIITQFFASVITFILLSILVLDGSAAILAHYHLRASAIIVLQPEAPKGVSIDD